MGRISILWPCRRWTVIAALAAVLAGCANGDERYDAGYSDGHAAGFNEECRFGSTLIEGDFENANYSSGYIAGQRAGVRDCRRRSGG